MGAIGIGERGVIAAGGPEGFETTEGWPALDAGLLR